MVLQVACAEGLLAAGGGGPEQYKAAVHALLATGLPLLELLDAGAEGLFAASPVVSAGGGVPAVHPRSLRAPTSC